MAAKAKPINSVSGTTNFVINALFWIYSLCCIIPVLIVISVSFSDENAVTAFGYSLIPREFSMKAYELLFEDWSVILDAYQVTLFITIVGTLLSVSIMALYAYPISRPDFTHRNLFTFYIFIPMLFGGGIVPFYLMYSSVLGLKDSLWALILPMVVSGFSIIIIRTFFTNTIPTALIEAATIDGASELRIFRSIVLPLSLPVLATIGLFSTLGYWNEWYFSLIFINSAEKVSLQYLMYKTLLNIQYLTANSERMAGTGSVIDIPAETIRMAMCVVGMGPIIIAYPFFQKYFVKGLTVGAIKG